ncbi:unnamed protein product, partial [Urochloa humidicola]
PGITVLAPSSFLLCRPAPLPRVLSPSPSLGFAHRRRNPNSPSPSPPHPPPSARTSGPGTVRREACAGARRSPVEKACGGHPRPMDPAWDGRVWEHRLPDQAYDGGANDPGCLPRDARLREAWAPRRGVSSAVQPQGPRLPRRPPPRREVSSCRGCGQNALHIPPLPARKSITGFAKGSARHGRGGGRAGASQKQGAAALAEMRVVGRRVCLGTRRRGAGGGAGG